MKRWPVIRHIRWLWLAWRVRRWAREWGNIGIGLGYPTEHDLRVLDAIWRGER
jgi:hypothetical protein